MHCAPLETSEGEATLEGTIRTADGQPIPPKIDVKACARMRNNSRFRASPVPGGFRLFDSGAVGDYLAVRHRTQLCPFLVTPFATKAGETHGGLDIVLATGFTSYIQVVDRRGDPIADATVNATLGYTWCSVPSGWKSFNDEGLVTADHLADFAYNTSRYRPPVFKRSVSVTLNFSPKRDDPTKNPRCCQANTRRRRFGRRRARRRRVIRRAEGVSSFKSIDDSDRPVEA